MRRVTHACTAIHPPGFLARAAGVSRRETLLVGTCVALALALLLVDLVTPVDVCEAMLYSFVVLISASAREERLTVVFASICTVFIGLGFVFSPPGADIWISFTNRCLAVALAWMTAGLLVRRRRAEQERDRALQEREEAQTHIRFLHGLLPICAWCKKIRATDGSWVKIEHYIAQHSDANFTHSICPECKNSVVHEHLAGTNVTQLRSLSQ